MTNYKRGRLREWQVKQLYEQAGFYAVRSAGSHGVADLVVVGRRQSQDLVLGQGGVAGLVQVKTTGQIPPPTFTQDRLRLAETAEKHGVWASLWVWVEGWRCWLVYTYEPGRGWREERFAGRSRVVVPATAE